MSSWPSVGLDFRPLSHARLKSRCPSFCRPSATASTKNQTNALRAGFDGVEVHGANGYLLDQFLQTANNRRVDDYGGSVENRARLLLDVIEAVKEVWDPDRVGVRLSPLGAFNDMADDDPEATFGYVVEKLNECDLAYLHVVRPRIPEAEGGSCRILKPGR